MLLRRTTTFSSSKQRFSINNLEHDVRGGLSPLKWAGGKGQIVEELEKRMPLKFNNYLEPFVGGASLFFNTKKKFEQKIPEKEYLILDNNRDLINFYLTVKYNLKDLILELDRHIKKYYSKDEKNKKIYYYEIRKLDTGTLSNVEAAARFIFLNKTCWNGLYRVNSSGLFNVPYGRNKNPRILDEEKLRLIKHLLKGTIIKHGDFSEVLKFARSGDFVYFDPPYFPISETSNFTDYTKSGFGKEDQERLFDVFETLDRRGCFLMLSNSYSKLIENLYKNYNSKTVIRVRRYINSKKDNRGPIKELIIRNYKTPVDN